MEDLTEIYEYTYQTWSENQADKYYESLIGICEYLAKNPKIGKKYFDVHDGLLGFLAKKHIIFYSIINSSTIHVIRILGADMDLINRIKE